MEKETFVKKLRKKIGNNKDLIDIVDKMDEKQYEIEKMIEVLVGLDDVGEKFSKEAIDYIIKTADKLIQEGKYDLANEIGALYYRGNNIKKDYKKAEKYYQIAADHGNIIAISNLGYCYYYGRTGKVDYKKAYEYFILGALVDDVTSLYKVGDMYKNGYHVKKNEDMAFFLYDKANNLINKDDDVNYQDYASVKYRLAKCYQNGTGCKANKKAALHMYNTIEMALFDLVYEEHRDYYQSMYEDCLNQQEIIRKELFDDLSLIEYNDAS